MFEKVYACLLRLFPSAFRKHYEEESLQLLRDRLHDEKGFFRRLRLSFDLLVDIFGAVPQAYRNSYSEPAPAASLAPQFEGMPSFRGLQEEPIQRGTIIFAGVLSLTSVLGAFSYVIEPSTPYHPDAHIGRISPIESVIERLNGPISPVSEGSVHFDVSETPVTGTGRLKAPSTPASKQVFSFATTSTSSGTRPGVQSPAVNYAEHEPSRAFAKPLAIAPEAQILASGPTGTVAIYSGRWTSSLQAVTEVAGVPQDFVFIQDSKTLTGTARAYPAQEYQLIHGLVDGNAISFEATDGRKRLFYDLTVAGKELRGTLSIGSGKEMQTTKVWLERVQ